MLDSFVYRHKKGLVISGALFLTIILITSVYFVVMGKINSAKIEVMVAPSIAKVKIGDRVFGSTGTYDIAPGEYTAEISADGFLTKTENIVANEGETTELRTFLDPTDENADWYNTHDDDAFLLGELKNSLLLDYLSNLREKYSILNYVPYIAYKYNLNYEENCKGEETPICLVIKADFGYRDLAVEYLQSTNVGNLSEYYTFVSDQEVFLNEKPITIPEGLSSEYTGDYQVDENEVGDVMAVANEFVRGNLSGDNYGFNISQIKKYNNFYGIKIRFYQVGDDSVYDTYRMIVGKVNDSWLVLSNADLLLSKYKNPGLPTGLLNAVNQL